MVNFAKICVFSTAFLASFVISHPGEKHDTAKIKRELDERAVVAAKVKRGLDQCANKPSYKAAQKRAVLRRAATAERLRKERGLDLNGRKTRFRRDAESWAYWQTVDHNGTGEATTDFDQVFGANTSCVLAPEQTLGPFFVTGEMIRSDVTEGQPGVPMHLEIQYTDITTCNPVASRQTVDIWHSNATGVYSGVPIEGPVSDAEGGLNSTFLRGVQLTDDDGVVEFDTIFPGHYANRATHIHVITFNNSTILPNDTVTGGTNVHIGQLYFDKSLRESVEQIPPYSTNNKPITTNAEDPFGPDGASEGYDPFVQYTYLSENLADGLLAWISVGLDVSANYNANITPIAFWEGELGGIKNPAYGPAGDSSAMNGLPPATTSL